MCGGTKKREVLLDRCDIWKRSRKIITHRVAIRLLLLHECLATDFAVRVYS